MPYSVPDVYTGPPSLQFDQPELDPTIDTPSTQKGVIPDESELPKDYGPPLPDPNPLISPPIKHQSKRLIESQNMLLQNTGNILSGNLSRPTSC